MDKTIRLVIVLAWLTAVIGGLVYGAGKYSIAWRDNDRKYQVKVRIAERSQCIKQFDNTKAIAANPEFSAISPLLKGEVGQCVLNYPIYEQY